MTTATIAQLPRRKWTWALWVAPLVIVLGGAAAWLAMMMGPPPADLDVSRTQQSANGLFTATIEPGADPIPLNQIHSWTIELEMADGTALAPGAIKVDGGMPQHGHGLPTAPQVTEDLGGGRFLVEGMKFNMPGWWVVKVHVGDDTATFNLTL
jgi:hypothetical protein